MKGIPILLLLLAAFGSGCHLLHHTAGLPASMIRAVVPDTRPVDPDLANLQVQVLRYADDFVSRNSAGLEEYARRLDTPEARTQALIWKVGLSSFAVGVATGPNPTADLLDLLTIASVARDFLE